MRQTLWQGALVLVTAGVINRLLGFIYRILVVRVVGPEGVGLYEMVFPLYSLVLVITTAGIPVAVAKIVAEQEALGQWCQVRRVFRVSFTVLILAGLTTTVLLLSSVDYIPVQVFPDSRALWPFFTTVPAIIVVAAGSALRGYFQGLHQMTPTAASQVCEQLVRITLGLYMAHRMLHRGPEYVAMGLASGMVAGEVVGFFILIIYYFKTGRTPSVTAAMTDKRSPPLQLFKEIWRLAFPVTIARIVTTSLLSIQALMIPQRLQISGVSVREATVIYGQYTGVAIALVNLPTVISVSLAISLVPAIAEAIARNDLNSVQRKCQAAIRLTIISGLPWATVYFLMFREISGLVFGLPEAGLPLQVLSIGCIFYYLQQTTGGILQGLGRVDLALRHVVLGAFVNLALVYWLTALPLYGILGTAAANSAGWLVVALLNTICVSRLTGLKFDGRKWLIAPLVASSGMGIAIILLWVRIWLVTGHRLVATLLALLIGLVCYLVLLGAAGAITKSDLQHVPLLRCCFR